MEASTKIFVMGELLSAVEMNADPLYGSVTMSESLYLE
jgi:hypothetical protein